MGFFPMRYFGTELFGNAKTAEELRPILHGGVRKKLPPQQFKNHPIGVFVFDVLLLKIFDCSVNGSGLNTTQ